MRIVCIECGEVIPAANINVQEMVAVCPTCDAVFRFDVDASKPKHRKIKAPEGVNIHDDAPLHLSYRGAFGQRTRGAALGIGFATFMFTIVLLTTIGGFLASDVPLFVPLLMGTMWSAGVYTLATMFWNTTDLVNDGHQIRTKHSPLPHPLMERDVSIGVDSIQSIYTEESYESKRASAAIRSYHIYAETYDGTRVLLLEDIPEHYAFYIEQQLRWSLETGDDDRFERLLDSDQTASFSEETPAMQQARLGH